MTDWKFDLDDVGPEADDDDEEHVGPPIEPGRPSLEHMLPFLGGVVLALYIFLQVL